MRSDARAATARVIRQKRSVLRSSLAVVYGCAREVLRTPALRVLVAAGLLVRVGAPVAFGRRLSRLDDPDAAAFARCAAGAVQACGSTAQRVGLSIGRSVVVAVIQFVISAMLVSGWRRASPPGGGAAEGFASPGPAPVRWAPGLVASALVGVVIGLTSAAADLGRLHALVTAAIAFGWSYVAAYVLPAIAIHGKGLIGSVRAAVGVLRATWGADIFAWSGVWLVGGIASLVGQIPPLLVGWLGADYRPQVRVANLSLGVPVEVTSEVIAVAFVTAILWAVEFRRSPGRLDDAALSMVTGIDLVDSAAPRMGADG